MSDGGHDGGGPGDRQSGVDRLLAELKRRRVFRVMAVYGGVAFVVLQVADILLPGLGLPDWTLRLVLVLLLLGFPVAIVLAWAFEMAPGGMQRTAPASDEEIAAIIAAPAARRWSVGIAALAGAVLLMVGAWWALGRGTTESRAFDSIAVLPFVNLSGQEEDEYLGDGLSEALLNALAQIEGLKVASRTSAFAFKGSATDARTIADSLNVQTVLEGSVRRSADSLRITAQLIAGDDGYHLWSRDYRRVQGDLLEIQDDLTRRIVEELSVKLGRSANPAAEARGTQDVTAYDYYLRGRYFWNKRTPEDMPVAIGLFEKAIEADSGFAPAYAAIAEAYAVPTGWGEDPRASLDAAERYARLALNIDPTLAQAHAALGYTVMMRDLDFPRAEGSFERAIELDPEYPTAHQWYAEFLIAIGRDDDAIREVKRAEELDPTPIIRWNVGRILLFAGRYDEAIEHRKRLAVAGDPRSRGMAIEIGIESLMRKGDFAAVLSLLSEVGAADVEAGIRDSLEARGEEPSGKLAGRLLIKDVEEATTENGAAGWMSPLVLAAWMRVEPDTVRRRLERLSREPEDPTRRYTWFTVLADAAFDPLRSEPEFRVWNERFGVRSLPPTP